MSTSSRTALVIGVNQYEAYDTSLGNPPGTSDLKGAIADALTFAALAVVTGTPPEQVTLLTAPPLDRASLPDQLRGARCGEATGAAIRAALQGLAQALAEDGTQGMLAFAGHGDHVEDDLVVCPTDTTAGLAGAIPFADVEQIFHQVAPRADLATFLETCHSGAASGPVGGKAHTLTRRSLPAALQGRSMRLPGVVLAAAQADQAAFELVRHGVWGGAFTRAVDDLTGRFLVQTDQGFAVRLTWGELGARVAAQLHALDLAQLPALAAPGRTSEAVLGGRGAYLPAGSALVGHEELWPGTTTPGFAVYGLTVDNFGGGFVVSTGSSPPAGWTANRTYWFFPRNGGTPVSPFAAATSSFSLSASSAGLPGGTADKIFTNGTFGNYAEYNVTATWIYAQGGTNNGLLNQAPNGASYTLTWYNWVGSAYLQPTNGSPISFTRTTSNYGFWGYKATDTPA